MTPAETSVAGSRLADPDGLGVLLAILVEGLLVVGYAVDDAFYHWLVHLYSGGAAGLLAASALHRALPRAGRPLRRALVAAVAGHVFAATPDLLFAAGRPHEAWMNLFIGHPVVERVPAGATMLLAAFLVALAGYLLTQVRRSARSTD